MIDLPEDDVPQSPATWENELVGGATELAGKALRRRDLEDEGAEQMHIAHEVRERYEDEKHHGTVQDS